MLLVALAAALGPTRLPPVDQCARDRSFVEFRTGLRRIIARRDGQALLAALAEDAQASFAADVGKKGFIQVWGLDSAKSSKIWKELGDALSLGCVLTSGQASVPGFESRIGAERDAFETLIALPGAVLRQAPSDRSSVVASLRWDVMTIDRPWYGGPWIGVRLDSKRRGFVRFARTRSPVGYRAWFSKRAGRWVMQGFLNGD